MRLTLQRLQLSNGCTIGELLLNGNHECWTLEDTVRAPGEKVPHQTAIPFGTYRVITDLSVRFGRVMLHVLDVPDFAGIRIHAGNDAADTDGCILVGLELGKERILQSLAALDQLQPKVQAALDAGEEVTIEVTQPVLEGVEG